MGKLYFIGLGLYDEKDVSVKGLKTAKNCDILYAEFYTSILPGTTKDLIEKSIGKKIQILSRKDVESGKKILMMAKHKIVGFLVPGDPMTATTHLALYIEAIKNNIPCEIIHGVSIFSACASITGLSAYKFGRTTTLCFPEKNYLPTSPYEVIYENKVRGLHTLVLLDIQNDKLMSANEGMQLLLQLENIKKQNIITGETLICALSQVSASKPLIKCGKLKNLITYDLGPKPHTIIIPGELHFMEQEAVKLLCGYSCNSN